jgi:PEP-CTERM motif
MTPRNNKKILRIAASLSAALIFGSIVADAFADPFPIKHSSAQNQSHPPIALNDVVYRNSTFRIQPALVSATYKREATTSQPEPEGPGAMLRNEVRSLEDTPEPASLILIGTGIFGLAAGIRYRFSKQNA